jgi:hypothetical protein
MNRLLPRMLALAILLIAAMAMGCASPTPSPIAQPVASVMIATATPLPTLTLAPSTPTTEPVLTFVSPETLKYDLVSDYCRHGQCLFTGAEGNLLIGIATLRGYFARVERTAWGETQVCDSFVITSGSKALMDFYLSLIDGGNTVNSKNELNQPIINLDLSGLSESEKQKLLASTAKNPVPLVVLSFKPAKEGEVGACYSFIEILKVDSTNDAPAIPLQQLGFKGQTFWTRAKNKEYSVIISYPGNWYLDPHSDASLTLVQNVPPFNNPTEVPGGLPEGVAKIQFMIDPNADPNALRGEKVTINGITWYRQVAFGGIAGDRSMTLETMHDGFVYRIQTYITDTGGKGPIFDYQAAILDQMIQSFRFGQ